MKALLPCILLSLILVGCSEPQNLDNQTPQLRYVRTATVTTGAENLFRELPGVVAANKQAQLSFRISGKVSSLSVKEGDPVKEGQILAKLDDTDTRIKLKSDQASYDKALADFNRGKELVANGTISQSEYNQLESALASAEANLNATKQTLLYSTLRAPFDGIIAKRDIENFEEVQSKQSVLILQDVSTIDIKVDVPESIMILTDDTSKPDVVAIFDAIPNQTFPLSLKEVATQADSGTNTYEVTMSMPRVSGFNILPGMSVTARARHPVAANDQLSNSVFVPPHAVQEDGTGRYAFIAMSNGDGTAQIQRREVVTGSLSSLGLEIVSGLEEGEQIVVAGMSKMFDGLKVRVDNE